MLNRKICKSTLSVISSAIILSVMTGCEKKPEYTNDDIKCGTFSSAVTGSEEKIVILPDSKIQFVNFDVQESAEINSDILKDLDLSYEEFEEIYTGECTYFTYFDNIPNKIVIVAEVYGTDAGIGEGYDYYFDTDTIVSWSDGTEYKLEASSEE